MLNYIENYRWGAILKRKFNLYLLDNFIFISVLFIFVLIVADDVGGPRREFLHLYMQEITSTLIEDRVILEKQPSLEQRAYYCLGYMMGE